MYKWGHIVCIIISAFCIGVMTCGYVVSAMYESVTLREPMYSIGTSLVCAGLTVNLIMWYLSTKNNKAVIEKELYETSLD